MGDTMTDDAGMNMKPKTRHAVVHALAAVLALGGGAAAAQQQSDGDAPAPPALAEGESGQAGEQARAPAPTRIHRRTEHGQTITEYYRGGKLVLMTVKPRVGPTQYWDDPDGDGQFQRHTSDNIDESLNLPKWKIGSW